MANNRSNKSVGRIPNRTSLKPQDGNKIPRNNIIPPPAVPKSPTSPSKSSRSSSYLRPPYGDGIGNSLKGDSFSQNSGSNGSKASILTPRTLPMTFKNISARFLPSEVDDRSASKPSKPRLVMPNPFKPTVGNDDIFGGPQYKVQGEDEDSISMSGSENSLLSHDSSQESLDLRMDRIYGNYSPLANNSSAQKTTPQGHSRSKSADFNQESFNHLWENRRMEMLPNTHRPRFSSDFSSDNRKVLFKNNSTSLEDPIVKPPSVKPPLGHTPSYGATNNAAYSIKNNRDEEYDDLEFSPLVKGPGHVESPRTFVSQLENSSDYGDKDPPPIKRSWRHRLYLILTDPRSSILSAIVYGFIVFLIVVSNLVIMMKTMDYFQYTPHQCVFCDRYEAYYESISSGTEDCTCPPETVVWLQRFERYVMIIFAYEWILRILCYDPPVQEGGLRKSSCSKFFDHLFETTTILDFLATFPYFIEQYDVMHWNKSLTFLRLFRVFQMVRLGHHDATFCAIVNVLVGSFEKLMLLFVFIAFGGAICSFLIYWFERGEWRYTDLVDPPGWAWVRLSPDETTEELSPFTSIPDALYWFIVTATTCGYGDVYPTSPVGKFIAGTTMLLGVLLIAFPVSVFSDMWQKELKFLGAYESLADSSKASGQFNFFGSKKGTASPPKIISTPSNAVFHASRQDVDESGHSLMFFRNSNMSTDGSVPLDDFQAIRHYMRVIEEAQQKINEIMDKMEESDRGVSSYTSSGRRFDSERPPSGRKL